MKEILFRSKQKYNSEWVEGYLVKLGKESFSDPERYGICNKAIPIGGSGVCYNLKIDEVIPETIGQYTGLTDKNGKKIFENGYMIIDNKTYKVIFDNAEYILTNIFGCDIITLKNNSIKGVFVDEI